MRGSSLAYPAVLESLRPFIVTYASARTVDEFPEDVRELCGPPGRRPRDINLGLMVLDENGRFIRQMMPFVRPPTFHFDPEAQGRDFKRQVDQLLWGLPIPPVPESSRRGLALPDVAGTDPLSGVRIYLTFNANRLNHYRTPTVEAVPTTTSLLNGLAYPRRSMALPPELLRPWLEQIYPPAIMDGKGGFEDIDAALTIRPAGERGGTRWAVIEGDVQFALDNRTRISYSGELSVVVEYAQDSTVPQRIRGVCDCTFPKHNPQGQVVERIRMTAAIESRPE